MHHDQTHSEAEKKIKEADHFWKRARELDLSGMYLTELPESLRQLTHLEVLDLSNNQLKNLPDWIGDLTQLRELRLGSPVNHVFLPLGDNPWPSWTDSHGAPFSENPVIASMKGLDGRSIFGTIDDYWISYNDNLLPDPYLGYGIRFSENTPDQDDIAGDAIRNSQSHLDNPDGDTTFYTLKSQPEHTSDNEIKDSPASLSEQENTNDFPSTELPGNVWKFWCSATAAGDIPSIYDQSRYPNLYTGSSSTNNEITDLPASLLQLKHLEKLDLDGNPLNPELAKAYKHGLNAVKAYLYTKSH